MKNKHMIAIILGIVCIALLASGCVWSMLDKDEPETDKPSQVEEKLPEKNDVVEEPEPAPDENSDKDEEKEEPEEDPKEEPEEKPEEKPVEDTPDNSDLAGYSGNANVATLTKAETEAILNNPYMILVNRDNVLDEDYTGIDLVSYGDQKMNRVAGEAMQRLISAGKAAGYNYVLYSGYRTYSRQYNNYYGKISYYENNGYSRDEAVRLTNMYYAPPGASEHHTGLAADVCIPSIVNKYACLHEDYEYTDEFKWFYEHAADYGFILRYRKGDESITGYNYEPWHFRYVGVDIATEIEKRDITFEEYVSDLKAHLKSFEG